MFYTWRNRLHVHWLGRLTLLLGTHPNSSGAHLLKRIKDFNIFFSHILMVKSHECTQSMHNLCLSIWVIQDLKVWNKMGIWNNIEYRAEKLNSLTHCSIIVFSYILVHISCNNNIFNDITIHPLKCLIIWTFQNCPYFFPSLAPPPPIGYISS